MGDQPRWPKGTPTGPTGPGGGRFRDAHGNAARALAQKIREMPERQVTREMVMAALHPKGPRLHQAGGGPNPVHVVEADDPHSENLGTIDHYGDKYHAWTPHEQTKHHPRGKPESFDSEHAATLFLWQHGMTERGKRERYNANILEDAIEMERMNLDDEDPDMTEELYGSDEELAAQIELVQKLRDGQIAPGAELPLPDGTVVPGTDPRAWDAAVDHLRGMLEAGYLDPWELPEKP